MKNILVTGGAGFIGSHLAERLLAENEWHVTIVDDFNDFYSPAIKWQNIKNLNYENLTLLKSTFAMPMNWNCFSKIEFLGYRAFSCPGGSSSFIAAAETLHRS